MSAVSCRFRRRTAGKLPEDVEITGLAHLNQSSGVYQFVRVWGDARRETDTIDTFWDSSRIFCGTWMQNEKQPFDADKVNAWMPVDLYRRREHGVASALFRFFTKALRHRHVEFDEPSRNCLLRAW